MTQNGRLFLPGGGQLINTEGMMVLHDQQRMLEAVMKVWRGTEYLHSLQVSTQSTYKG